MPKGGMKNGKNYSYYWWTNRIVGKRKEVGWLCMSNIKVVVHNQNTEEESFRMASYLFMTSNLQIALDVVNRELNSDESAMIQQETA